MLIYTVGYRY